MPKSGIEVYARPRPTDNPTPHCKIDSSQNAVFFHIPIDLNTSQVNNTKTDYTFAFTRVFEPNVTQEVVFEEVAKKSVYRYHAIFY